MKKTIHQENGGGKCSEYYFYASGNLKKLITYRPDGVTKYWEYKYHENGQLELKTEYCSDGKTRRNRGFRGNAFQRITEVALYCNDDMKLKHTQFIYHKNEQTRLLIIYKADGMTIESERTYDEDGKMKADSCK